MAKLKVARQTSKYHSEGFGSDAILGSEEGDLLVGNESEASQLWGGKGRDTFVPRGEHDFISTGPGRDTIALTSSSKVKKQTHTVLDFNFSTNSIVLFSNCSFVT